MNNNELTDITIQENEVDQTILANDLSGKIPYEMLKEILVKPLPVTKIKRIREVPVVKEVTNDDGIEVNDFEETTQEEIEVESNFREGIILKLPLGIETPLQIGDKVIYNARFAVDFDLFRDSQLVKLYDVTAKVN